MKNYDPNLTNCGKCAEHTVELTFQMWDYTKTIRTTVGGNTRGLSVIECAVENIEEDLGGEDGRIVLKRRGGATLECELWEEKLSDMLVAARIVSIKPDGDVNEFLSRGSTKKRNPPTT